MPEARCPRCGAENDLQLDLCVSCGSVLAGVGPGSVLGDRFELLVEVGKGGMGWVFRAHDRLLDEEVGVKVLRPDLAGSEEVARRFRREIRLARRVAHPNICRIFEYGEEDRIRYISMEYIDGVDLRSALSQRGSGFPADEAFTVVRGVASGLAAVHEEGIIHRDLKSGNVMIDASGVPRLLDFGIARDIHETRQAELSLPGMIMGTPEYMSPEQCRGLSPDARSDIYSLAIVCYEIFTGTVPFRGASQVDTVVLQMKQPPPLEQGTRKGLPEALVEPLGVALAKDREARFESVAAFLEALESSRVAAHTESPPLVSIPASDRRRDRRLEIPVACRIRFSSPSGQPGEERTVTENISRGGAQVMTTQTHLTEGARIVFAEVDGPFETRAVVRDCRRGPDGIQRLHLKFLDHAAPDRLVGGTPESRAVGGAPPPKRPPGLDGKGLPGNGTGGSRAAGPLPRLNDSTRRVPRTRRSPRPGRWRAGSRSPPA